MKKWWENFKRRWKINNCEHDWKPVGNGATAICTKCDASGVLQHPGMW